MTLWLASVALAAPEVHRYGILVGSNEGRPSEPALSYAERDAERVASVLTELGGFRSEDLVVLKDEPADRVREVFADLARRMAYEHAPGTEDLLFVYFSGHGDGQSLHLGRTDLRLSDLKALADAAPADVRVLVVDSCRSGELTRLKGAVPAEPFAIRAEDRLDSEGLAIITSSSAGEDAQESERLEGGVFTHHFVAGLLGAADSSGDGRVTLSEAYRYGYARTLESTSQAPVVQHPTYAFDLRGREDLVLTRMGEDERAGRLVLRDPGTWLVFAASRDGALQTEATVEAGQSLSLPQGQYVVRLREPDVVRETEVTVTRGQEVSVSRAQMASVPYGATVRRGLSDRRSSAWAGTVGGGVTGPWVPDTVAAPLGAVGVRVDLPDLSLGLRVHAAQSSSAKDFLTLDQRRVGFDLEAVRRIDVGMVAPGVGVRVGGDRVAQVGVSEGEAPPHTGLVGRVGPWIGADLALSARAAIGVQGGFDVEAYRPVGAAVAALPVPYALVELVAYAR